MNSKKEKERMIGRSKEKRRLYDRENVVMWVEK